MALPLVHNSVAHPGATHKVSRVSRPNNFKTTSSPIAYTNCNHNKHIQHNSTFQNGASRGARQKHTRSQAVTTQATATAISPGDLVEWRKGRGWTTLGLVSSCEDNKKHIWVLDAETGRKASIQPRQVLLHLPGPFTHSDARSMAAMGAAAQRAVSAAQAALAVAAPPGGGGGGGGAHSSQPPKSKQPHSAWGARVTQPNHLGDVWNKMPVGDDLPPHTLSQLAVMVAGDDTPSSLYRVFKMLEADRLYFRLAQGVGGQEKGGGGLFLCPLYRPRTADAVDAARAEIVRQVAAAREREAWVCLVAAALGREGRSGLQAWEELAEGPCARRVGALKHLALRGAQALDTETLSLARESLGLLGIHPHHAPPAPIATSTAVGSSRSCDPHSSWADAAARLLVGMGALQRHAPLAALRRGVALQFPEAVEAAGQAVARPEMMPEDACAGVRVDLTHLRCYTVDEGCVLQVDDAVSVELVGGGNLGGPVPLPQARVWIHVADPTRWLSPASSQVLMEEAKARLRTLYFPWGFVPMFPRALAEGVFSLREGRECDALSICAEVGDDGAIGAVSVVPSRVRVTRKLSYDEADAILGRPHHSHDTVGGCVGDADYEPAETDGNASRRQVAVDLSMLQAVSQARRAMRLRQGAMDVMLPEARVEVPPSDLDAENPRVTIRRICQWESASRGLVSELMVLAGEAAGMVGKRACLPLPYRHQAPPVLPPQADLDAVPAGPCRGYLLRKVTARGGVSATAARHAGLGVNVYVQVTSPIRRFPDVIAHANLKALAMGVAPPYTASDVDALAAALSSGRARDCAAAERGEDAYWAAEFFRQQQGRGRSWAATVLGWLRKEQGLASVMIDELGYETLVKLEGGQAKGVAPGSKVTLVVAEAVPPCGMLRFAAAGVGGEHGPAPRKV